MLTDSYHRATWSLDCFQLTQLRSLERSTQLMELFYCLFVVVLVFTTIELFILFS